MKLNLSSKAKTLEDLGKVVTGAEVLPLVRFNVKSFASEKNNIISECIKTFSTNVIVRSSSANEDNNIVSNAGAFKSVADIRPSEKEIEAAVNEVISSYGESINDRDEVFIQPMLKDVTMSGVVFTADIDTLASYYIINYDTSGSTTSVTGGEKADLHTFISVKDYNCEKDHKISAVISACRECEEIFNNEYLDIEFAFSGDRLYILQVREIVRDDKVDLKDVDLMKSLEKLYSKIKKLNSAHPKLLGSKSIFGVMPDWNPAEIIGIKPKRLAISLYKELITDEIWAYQRDNYGYRNLRSFPLLVTFLGVPFIDVRVSFNSFIPKSLDESIASKLVEYYLEKLASNSTQHDKVEFEIVFSCYFFGLNNKLSKLMQHGFNENELKRIEFSLLELTNNVINTKEGLYKNDLNKIELLEEKYDSIINSQLSLVDKIYWLIEDCKRYGTLPFAGVARAAFIAIQILNSFADKGILTLEQKNNFLNSLNTVSKKLSNDKNCMNKNDFLSVYGHLRPGTYDICSSRYDEAYDFYFSDTECSPEDTEFNFTDKQMDRINLMLVEHGIKCNGNELIQFIKEAIEGREYAKFAFTKHLSKILCLIEEFGNKQGISREDLAYLDIQQVKNLYATLDHREVKDIFESDIEKNKEYYRYTKAVKFPGLIINENDIYSFFMEKNEPNFITLNQVNAETICIDSSKNSDYSGKIVLIKSADPGFDYLFAKNIAGLITCYGGANSHMAIRCAELGIPAVIGCGENTFQEYSRAKRISIDAANKQVKIIV